MIPSQKCVDLIKKFEGFRGKSYLDTAGIPTIGYGSTFWTDGSRVKLGQEVSMEGAEKLLCFHLANIIHMIPKNVNQNQHDALACLMYNIGVGNFRKSTLLKRVTANPDDPTIKDEFMKWTFARFRGSLQQLPGLLKRRTMECNLYFEKI